MFYVPIPSEYKVCYIKISIRLVQYSHVMKTNKYTWIPDKKTAQLIVY
jgi:hypothetical protein